MRAAPLVCALFTTPLKDRQRTSAEGHTCQTRASATLRRSRSGHAAVTQWRYAIHACSTHRPAGSLPTRPGIFFELRKPRDHGNCNRSIVGLGVGYGIREWVSRRRRQAERPRRPLWCSNSNVHIHGCPSGAAFTLKIRPTTTPSASTSKSSSLHSPEGREADARLRIK